MSAAAGSMLQVTFAASERDSVLLPLLHNLHALLLLWLAATTFTESVCVLSAVHCRSSLACYTTAALNAIAALSPCIDF
jgi:hypothetical protein